jgi:enamine deaminase RidA (YjgF/YER057c/UK114 family)
VFVSGQLPLDANGEAQLGTIEEQTTLCMKNIETILRSCNSDLNHILKQMFLLLILLTGQSSMKPIQRSWVIIDQQE